MRTLSSIIPKPPARPERNAHGKPGNSVFHWILLCTLTAIFAICINSCQQTGHTEAKPHWFKHYKHYHEKDYVEYIEKQVNNDSDSSLAARMTRNFYRSRNFHPLWTKKGLQENLTDSLIACLSDAYTSHGIPSAYFETESLQNAIRDLMEQKVPDNDSLYIHLYRIERLLTDDFLRYARALHFGATDPKAVHGSKWYYEVATPDSAFYLKSLENITTFRSYLSQLSPDRADYQVLQKELERLSSLTDTTLNTIPDFRARKNERNTNIPTLNTRLRQLGYASDSTSTTLSDKVLENINSFRRRNGIPESDSLDTETIGMLNRPIQYYKDAIAANMERLRWRRTHSKSDDTLYIAVNIPDYTLQVVQCDSVVMRNRICCGKTQNPTNVPSRHRNGLITPYKAETPLLFSMIRTITLNPEWNIPYDIIKNEYYPKLVRSNTSVVNRERLYIRDSRNGNYVVPDSINWSRVRQSNIPYRLHQTSGRHNALGLYKFVFSNSESVYLHDTNNKGAFRRRRRALSHGCVRVQHPDSVAEWAYRVNGFDTNYIEQLHIITGSDPTTEKGEEFVKQLHEKDSIYYERLSNRDRQFYRKLRPTSVALRKPIPLFIEYYTCFVGEDGTVHYREDIYYKDANILYLLNHPNRKNS